MKKACVALVLIVLTSLAAWTLPRSGMKPAAGTWHVGGSATIDIDTVFPSSGDSVSGFKLALQPSGGYFVADNLMVAGELRYEKGFGDLYDLSDSTFGLGVGARYYLETGSFISHFGALVGMSFTFPESGSTTKWFTIVAPVGVLVPMNAHVAVDLGLRASYVVSLDNEGSKLSIPVGCLGIQAFF
jgi:hypothetical protein